MLDTARQICGTRMTNMPMDLTVAFIIISDTL